MRKALPLIIAVVVGAAIAVGGFVLIGGDDDDGGGDQSGQQEPAALKDASSLEVEDEFSLKFPKSWKRVANADLGVESGRPLAAIRRTDDAGQMIVQRAGKLEDTLDEVGKGLTTRLKKQIKDFRLVRSNQVDLPAGKALSYTFVRTKTGQIQNLTVVPKGEKTFTLNSVVGGANDAAVREVAVIVRSFDPED